jgi:hypothetical protein
MKAPRKQKNARAPTAEVWAILGAVKCTYEEAIAIHARCKADPSYTYVIYIYIHTTEAPHQNKQVIHQHNTYSYGLIL